MHPFRTRLLPCGLAVALVVGLGPGLGSPAAADPARCEAAIVKASAAYVQARSRALQKCREKVVRGKFPRTTECLGDVRTGFALARAARKLERNIASACGGKDRSCGTADDESLAEVGWGAGACPGYREAGCTQPIASCADVATCLECIGSAAVDESIGLSFDDLVPSDPKSEREVNRCQAAIGKATSAYLARRSKLLARCWKGVAKGKAEGPCPLPGDGKTADALAVAEVEKIASICKACGGEDAFCGGDDDVAAAAIGFPASCPDVAECTGAVGDLVGIVGCVDCVADFASSCADGAAVPGRTPYPDACKPPPPPQQGFLNFSLPPVYGSSALSSGFVPDPFSVGITAGGPVNVSYLGGGCSGFATSAPSFSVNYTAGAFPTLRFYFIGGANTTMIINTPGGSYVCVDDSFGTLNPTIDFNSPSSGRYDVWIASYAAGGSAGGTLYVTESVANHP